MKPPKLIWVVLLMLVIWSCLFFVSRDRAKHHRLHSTAAAPASTNLTNTVSIQLEPNSTPVNNSFGRDNFTITLTNH